jgi:anti-sigma B factor antagonist
MRIEHLDRDDVLVMMLEGRIDFEGAAELDRTLKNAIANGRCKIVLDMGQVDYLNTAGLHVLADVQVENQRQGGDLRLARLSPIVQRVFQIVGFRRFFRNYATVDAAITGW